MKKETFKAVTPRGRKMEVTVGIKNEDYGWFELYDEETGGDYIYAEGGLWFKCFFLHNLYLFNLLKYK